MTALALRPVLLGLACSVLIGLPRLAGAADEDGFVRLFDGRTLQGWMGDTDGYEVADEAITCIPKKGGNLLTEKEFSDFILRLDFRVPPRGNNGVGIRAPRTGHIATLGMEIQILDNTHPDYARLAPYQFHGSVYGLIPAKRGYLRPAGEWNSQEVRCVGPRVTVVLNGETIVDGDVQKAAKPQAMDGKEHPGVLRTAGHIGFLGHGDRVQFRNIRVKELK